MADNRKQKNHSERLFERYLEEYGYQWDYEPQTPGKSKRPDFLARRCGVECFLEVKERAPRAEVPDTKFINPIKGVRELIAKGRKTFKEFGECLCAVVLEATGDCETYLNPFCIFASMLGDPGFSVNFDAVAGTIDLPSMQNVFLHRGGKMIRHYVPLKLYESTKNISAIVVPSLYRVPNPAFDLAVQNEVERRVNDLGRILSAEERFEIRVGVMQSISQTLMSVPRVVVCANPFARHRLPDNIFDDPYDERWALKDNVLKRVFAGSQFANVNPNPFQQ